MGIMDAIAKSIISSASTSMKKSLISASGRAAADVILATGKAVSENRETNNKQSKLVIPFDNYHFCGMNYLDAKEELEAYGFSNFGLLKQKDLIKGWLNKDGEVISVTINGKSEFKKKQKFPRDSHVVIKYHTFKNVK